jgi:hypothetical protein
VIWRPAGKPRQSHKNSQVGATSSPLAAWLPWIFECFSQL